MRLKHGLPFLLLFAVVESAQAFTSVPGVRGGGQRLTAGLIVQETEYEAGTSEFDVEGNLLAVGYKAALNDKFALGAGLGLLLDGEIEGLEDGSGFRFFVDGDYEFTQFGQNQLIGTFQLVRDAFSYDEPRDVDFDVTEIKIGGLILHRIQNVALYGGLEAYLYSDGDLGDTDVERNSPINVRLGLAFAATPSVDVRADLFLITEQTLMLAADFRI